MKRNAEYLNLLDIEKLVPNENIAPKALDKLQKGDDAYVPELDDGESDGAEDGSARRRPQRVRASVNYTEKASDGPFSRFFMLRVMIYASCLAHCSMLCA